MPPDALATGIGALSTKPHIVVANFFLFTKKSTFEPKLKVLVFYFFLED